MSRHERYEDPSHLVGTNLDDPADISDREIIKYEDDEQMVNVSIIVKNITRKKARALIRRVEPVVKEFNYDFSAS